MPEDLKPSQIGSFPLSPPFRGLHSPGVRKHCQVYLRLLFPEIVYCSTVGWIVVKLVRGWGGRVDSGVDCSQTGEGLGWEGRQWGGL